jgi:2-oxoglutarate dehydrogenase E2 component (dihydrolipoamide succinyltransferase)
MAMEIKVPAMGESITEATIGRILKPSGSFVKTEEEMLELETDKVNQVLYASQEGVVQWNIQEGDTVKIGQVLGSIGEGVAQEEKPAPKKVAPQKPFQEASVRISKEEFLKEPSLPPPPIVPSIIDEEVTRKRMPKIRQVIAKRLVEVQQTTAMLTTFNEVDLTEVQRIRQENKESFLKKHGVKLGLMSFFVKASCSALKAFPDVNSRIEGDEIVTPHHAAISIAVSTDRGLVVPVLKKAEMLNFAQIEKAIIDFAVRAKEGRLAVEEFQGGSFTITNGGIFGSLLSTPIINSPQSAILGMHTISPRAMVIGDKIEARPMMYLALSYDHRIIDGKEAVSFLVHIKKVLEDPSTLLLSL